MCVSFLRPGGFFDREEMMSDHITLKNGEKKLIVKLSDFGEEGGFSQFEEHVRKEFDKEQGVRAAVEENAVLTQAHEVLVTTRDRSRK